MRHHAARDRRRQRRLALAHAPELLDEDRRRLVFEQIAECARLQRREKMVVVVVDGDDHRLRFGLSVSQGSDDIDAGAIRQAEVDQREAELDFLDQSQGFVNACSVEEGGVGIDLQDLHLQPGRGFWNVFQQQDFHHRSDLRLPRRVILTGPSRPM